MRRLYKATVGNGLFFVDECNVCWLNRNDGLWYPSKWSVKEVTTKPLFKLIGNNFRLK